MLVKMVGFYFCGCFINGFSNATFFIVAAYLSQMLFFPALQRLVLFLVCASSPTVFADVFHGYTGVSACSQYYGPGHMEKEQNQNKNFK